MMCKTIMVQGLAIAALASVGCGGQGNGDDEDRALARDLEEYCRDVPADELCSDREASEPPCIDAKGNSCPDPGAQVGVHSRSLPGSDHGGG